MYLLTEWEGRTGKYLVRGHGVRTERSEVRVPWPRAKYFPVRPDLTQSISILLYDHHAFPFSLFFAIFFLFFRVTKFRMLLILTEKSGFIQQQSCFSSLLARAIDKIPVWELYAILAGPDGLFRTCSRHHVRPSYGDFLNSFAMKARAGPYGSYNKMQYFCNGGGKSSWFQAHSKQKCGRCHCRLFLSHKSSQSPSFSARANKETP